MRLDFGMFAIIAIGVSSVNDLSFRDSVFSSNKFGVNVRTLVTHVSFIVLYYFTEYGFFHLHFVCTRQVATSDDKKFKNSET